MRAIPHEATAGIYFNKRLLQEAGIDPESIYELQRNKEWTWDKFEELCQQVQKDTDNDGVIDQYAMTNFTSTSLLEKMKTECITMILSLMQPWRH